MDSRELPLINLRRFRDEDALTHLRGEDEATSRWLSGGTSTEDSVREWIRQSDLFWNNGGPRFVFAIEEQSGNLVGMIEVNLDYAHFAGLRPGDANVSYGLYPQHRGRGYATAAVSEIHDFLKSKDVRRSIIRVERENVASIDLARRCHYREAGTVINGAGTEYLLFVNEMVET